MSYTDVRGPITAAAAEAEPLDQRLFSRPASAPSRATVALFRRVQEGMQREKARRPSTIREVYFADWNIA